MTEHYLKNYRVLGIPPGASWKQLRQAYKKLVNVWHPDRYQQNARKKRQAEEKTKEITRAYKELAEYHKKFGVLPLTAEEPPPLANAEHSTSAGPAGNISPSVSDPGASGVEPDAGIPKQKIPIWRARLITGTVVLSSVYFLWQFIAQEDRDHMWPNEIQAGQAVNAGHLDKTNGIKPDEIRFTIGSSLGEVYSVQGIPTKTENEIWHYGSSKVYFSKGKVFGWDENNDSPLRVEIISDHKKANQLLFGQGSKKEEVLAAQGKPDRDFGSVWDYGISRVYFENERVTRWHESALNPLHVKR